MLVTIEEKYRVELEGYDTSIQGYIDDEGKHYVSALGFLRAIGNRMEHKLAMRVVRHHKTHRLFQLTEIQGMEVPLLPLRDINDLRQIAVRVEATKADDLRSKKRPVVGHHIDREQAEKAYLGAVRQLARIAIQMEEEETA